MKQIYIPYIMWEDFNAGMWRKLPKDQERRFLDKAIEFTGDTELYGMAMQIVIDEWPLTMLNSLTNPGINKRAFLGHCAACWAEDIPEYITRQAWYKLTQKQRTEADEQAELCIKKYLTILKHGNSDVIPMVFRTKPQMKFQTLYRLINEYVSQ